MKHIHPLLLCHFVLYSCTTAAPPDDTPVQQTVAAPAIQTFVYECPGDFSFVARIENDKAWLFLPGNTLNLPRVESASGAKFTAAGGTFWSKGDEAMLETSAGRHAGCLNNRAKAIWEHAKLNGVDFRAIGNEPGWYLEISNKMEILLVTDYGEQTRRYTASSIQSSPHSRTGIYHAGDSGKPVEIIIEGQPCSDSMSGEAFPATVSVSVNNRLYSGCGKALH